MVHRLHRRQHAAVGVHRLLPGRDDLPQAGADAGLRIPLNALPKQSCARPWAAGLALWAAAALVACGDAPQAPAAPAAGAGLETLTVAASTADGERLFDGLVEAIQQATLVAQTGGRVVAIERDVDDRVTRGALILRLAGVEQRAQLDAARQAMTGAEALAHEAGSTYERVRDLAARRLLSQSDLDRATAGRDAANARLAAARAGVDAARQQSSYTEIRAPFAGVVTARHVEVGEAVAPGQPLTAIAAPGALRVNVDVPQALADEVRALGAARVHADGRAIEAAQLTVFPAAASGSNTVRVRVDLPPGVEGLYPGMFAKVGFRVGGGALLRIPLAAVAWRSEVTGAYVVAADGALSLRQLRLGRTLGDEVEVLAGLAPGERIATDPVAATLALAGGAR